MANEFNRAAQATQNLTNAVSGLNDAVTAVSDKPEVADRPSFLKDVKNGLFHVAKTIWAVPEARGYLATLLVRLGVASPAIVAVVMAVIDGLAK